MQVELAERFAEERYLDYASLASLQAVFRIRMDPVFFFADPDPSFKNPEPSVFSFNFFKIY